MISYNGFTFTSELVEEIASTVGTASDEAILEYVKGHPELKNGCRLVKGSCLLFRKRVTQHIKNLKDLDKESADLLYNAGLGQAFIVVLSYDVLRKLLYEFAGDFGRSAFALGLLLDSRVEVHGLGLELIGEHQERCSQTEAQAIIADALGRFSTNYNVFCGVEPRPTGGAEINSRESQELARKLKAEEKRNRELSERLKEEKDVSVRQLAEKNGRIEVLDTELKQLKKDLAAARSESDKLAAILENERRHLGKSITDGVDSRLKNITSRWLFERIKVEAGLKRIKDTGDILEQADAVLAQQEQADRHIGNRKRLRNLLEAVSAKLAEVREASMNALHPLKALAGIEAGLVEEICRIEALLNGGREHKAISPHAQALAARINSTVGGAGLHHLEGLFGELCLLGLSHADKVFLQRCFCDRYDRLVAEHKDRDIALRPLNPALRFHAALGEGKQIALYCDGHNILNSMDYFRDACSRSHSDARHCLTESVAGLIGTNRNCCASIVFDGPEHNREIVSENLTVIYSGGGQKEKHRADKRIEELLNWRSFADTGEQVFVVSADNDVIREARENRAEVIPLEQFGWMLG